MLIILSGLPGTGKTTIARELARQIGAMHLRIDTIEQALRDTGLAVVEEGYRVAYALAEDNLRLGRTVIADSVNPLQITRDAWRDVAKRAGVQSIDIEIICSDTKIHQQRVVSRQSDIKGHKTPTWQTVCARAYHPWNEPRTIIDTASESPESSIARIRSNNALHPSFAQP